MHAVNVLMSRDADQAITQNQVAIAAVLTPMNAHCKAMKLVCCYMLQVQHQDSGWT